MQLQLSLSVGHVSVWHGSGTLKIYQFQPILSGGTYRCTFFFVFPLGISTTLPGKKQLDITHLQHGSSWYSMVQPPPVVGKLQISISKSSETAEALGDEMG